MATPRWSTAIKPRSVMFHLDSPSTSGGPSVTGFEQVVVSNAARWRATMTFNIVKTNDMQRVLYWRWFVAYMQGRANSILIGPNDQSLSPAELAGDVDPNPIKHSDGSVFSDGSGYVQPRTPAHVAGYHAAGATSLMVNMLGGHTPQPGQWIGIGERLHSIVSVELYSPYLAGFMPAYWQLTVTPRLRVAVSDGTFADFDDPVCKMRWLKDDTAQLTIQPYSQGEVTLELIETLPSA